MRMHGWKAPRLSRCHVASDALLAGGTTSTFVTPLGANLSPAAKPCRSRAASVRTRKRASFASTANLPPAIVLRRQAARGRGGVSGDMRALPPAGTARRAGVRRVAGTTAACSIFYALVAEHDAARQARRPQGSGIHRRHRVSASRRITPRRAAIRSRPTRGMRTRDRSRHSRKPAPAADGGTHVSIRRGLVALAHRGARSRAQADDAADQRPAESVSHDRPAGRSCPTAHVGLDERGGDRRDGKSIWVAERCGTNSCASSTARPGAQVRCDRQRSSTHFGAGLIVAPHGIFVDRDDNVWVVDCACTGGGAWSRRVRPAGTHCRATEGPSDLQVQPRRQAADDARQAGRRARPGLLLPAERRARRAERRHLRGRGPFVGTGKHGTPVQVLERREADQDVGKARQRDGATTTISRMRWRWIHAAGSSSAIAATTGSRFSIRTASCSTRGISSAGRAASSSTRRTTSTSPTPSRSRSAAGERGLEARHPHRQREGRIDSRFIPDPVDVATNTSSAEGVAADPHGVIYGAEVGPTTYGPDAPPHSLKRYVRR